MKKLVEDFVVNFIACALGLVVGIFLVTMLLNVTKGQTSQSMVSCKSCDGVCRLSHKIACETDHNSPNYYYYTYKCEDCEKEFTIEIIKEIGEKF